MTDKNKKIIAVVAIIVVIALGLMYLGGKSKKAASPRTAVASVLNIRISVAPFVGIVGFRTTRQKD